MSAVGLEGLERTVQLTHAWINDLNDRFCWNDKSRAYRPLKAVLHALRDWLHSHRVLAAKWVANVKSTPLVVRF